MENQGCFIDGKWVDTSQKLAVTSPWSGEVVGEVSLAGTGEWEAAITAAERAAAALRKMSSQERRQMLESLAAGVKAVEAELARTILAEGGKPITYARAEVSRGVMTLSSAVEEAARLGGEVLPLDLTRASAGRWGITRRFPVGPVLGITPFNFPFNLVAHKVGPALAAGNPIIIKPSSACPLTALMLAEVWDRAGAAGRGAPGAALRQPPGRGGGGRRPPEGPVVHRQRRGGLGPEGQGRQEKGHPGAGGQRRLHHRRRGGPGLRGPPGRHRRLRPRQVCIAVSASWCTGRFMRIFRPFF